jgi:hypothetical protein
MPKPNSTLETKIELKKTGAATIDVHTLYHMVPSADGSLSRETFERRHSGDPEVRALAIENLPGENISQQDRGLKLMRVSTRQMLAAFRRGKHQRVLNPRRVAVKLRFLGPEVLDPLVIVMTILSIVEKSRRNVVHFTSSATVLRCHIS